MTTKQCTKCKTTQPLANFSRHASTKDGLHTHCKQCVSVYNKQYREKHPDYMADYGRQWREAHSGYVKAYYKQWREANKDKRRANHLKREAAKQGSKGEVTAQIISQMCEDQGWLCAYCEGPIDQGFHVDHMIPLSLGGLHHWSNLAITCPECNMRKKVDSVEAFMLKKKKKS